jgi:hypothetical protein
MSQTVAVWLVIALGFGLANLPFVTERLFGVVDLCRFYPLKPLWVRLLELILFYLLVGLLGIAFESTLGNAFKQNWEFYAITFSLFLVLAFPGFVYRYLLKH